LSIQERRSAAGPKPRRGLAREQESHANAGTKITGIKDAGLRHLSLSDGGAQAQQAPPGPSSQHCRTMRVSDFDLAPTA
jgi:hypothetical protein